MSSEKPKANQAAVELGRLGGLARARKHGRKKLSEWARRAAKARHARKRKKPKKRA